MWRKELEKSICTAQQLSSALQWSEECIPDLERISRRFPMRITPYYLSLIDPGDPNDPISRLCIPSEDELDAAGTPDTSGESQNVKQKGVQHKYAPTALILSSNECAMYCRHCFRKRMVGLSDAELNTRITEAAAYVRSHPEITNVLLTGGDALMNPNHILARYLRELASIDSLDYIRIGSRIPVTLPSRIYADGELLQILEQANASKPICLITHIVHPRELTEEALRAVRAVQRAGVQVRNQAVLLKGVNDDPDVMRSLLRSLTRAGIAPYYIFQCRPVTGVKSRFQVPLLDAVKIVNEAKADLSGLEKAVRFCMSHTRGKIEILGETAPGELMFKFHQHRDSTDAARIFRVKLSENAAWLDDDLCSVS